MNILVTGATGFIGKHIVKELVKGSGCNVICLVRKNSRIAELDKLGVDFAFGDITDFDSLMAISYHIDVVFHCAAHVGQDRKKLIPTNIDGTRNVFEFCFKRKIKRIIYTSSVAVTSGHDITPLTEELPYAANNNYGWSKIEAEKIAIGYRNKGLNVAIIRPSMVYGPDEPHLMKYLLWLLKNRFFPLFNAGRQKLHMGYIGNVVDAHIFAMSNDQCLSGTYYIADREVLTAHETISCLASGLNVVKPKPANKIIESLLACMPVVGDKVKSFRKDRIYSLRSLEQAGFKFRFNAHEALTRSARDFDCKKGRVV
jgi:nucleoside-diphosphate-sugar epimerase